MTVPVHLNAHSHFSLLEALPSPADLAECARANAMPALALTDHRSLAGAVEFTIACRKAGVRPLLGLEVDLPWPEGAQRLTLLAENLSGWPELCRLSSALNLRGEEQPLCSLDLLSQYSNHLIAISGDQGDPSGQRLRPLMDIFKDRLYASLQNPDGSAVVRVRRTAELADFLHLPVVAVQPIYYLQSNQASLQRTLAAIRTLQPREQLPPETLAPAGACFLSGEALSLRFAEFPAALQATVEIAERCTLELPLGQAHYPAVPLPPGQTPAQTLRQKAEHGARRLYGKITPVIQTRLDHELEVIAARGYEPIFLIVEEILNYARQTGITTSSRGSAASSLVAHCIGITSPDPLALDLYFERFLNPARATPPDIDTDLDSGRRDEIIQHVFKTYGAGQVAMVGTINRMRPRSALGEVAKAYRLPPDEVRELANTLPYAFFHRVESEEEDGKPRPSPFAELAAAHPQQLYQHIFADAEALLKLPRHLSVHAGGLVIAPGPLTDLAPLQRSGSKGITITQMDLESVEALGLVKIDLLGIRGLSVLGDVAAAVRSWRLSEFHAPLDVLDSISLEDDATTSTVEAAQTIGCFQIESPGMRTTLKEINARTPDDIMVALALYRPGPLSGGLKDAFVRRFKGEEPVIHLHPALAPLVEDTFGVILYQEQVLRIAHGLAGFSLAEADLLRRAMSHFDPGKQMIALKQKFVQGALEKHNVPPETGEHIWELMAAFAGYGFPKAHAASYAQISWRSAWCKTHYPAEFMAAVLANWGGYYSQRVYLNEVRRLKLEVHPPHINHSTHQFRVMYRPAGVDADCPILYMGLDQVRELTRRTIERLCRARPFTSLEDFVTRVDPRRQEAESLIKVGALEGLGSIPALLRQLESGRWEPGQMSLFGWDGNSVEPEWSLTQQVAAQEELLGVSLAAHPLELVTAQIQAAGAITTVEAAGQVGKRVTVAGIRQSGHRSRTAKGDPMMFLTLEDLEGTLDAVIFPDVYRRARFLLSGSAPLLYSGEVERDSSGAEALLRVEKVQRLTP